MADMGGFETHVEAKQDDMDTIYGESPGLALINIWYPKYGPMTIRFANNKIIVWAGDQVTFLSEINEIAQEILTRLSK